MELEFGLYWGVDEIEFNFLLSSFAALRGGGVRPTLEGGLPPRRTLLSPILCPGGGGNSKEGFGFDN